MRNNDTDTSLTKAERPPAASAPGHGPIGSVVAFFARRRLLIIAVLACLAWLVVWAGFWAASFFGGSG